MGQLTVDTPKPMLEIKGKPILAYKIETLPEEVDEVILVVGYLRDQIQRYFGNEYAGKKISYVVQEKLEGSGAALHLAKDILRNDFLVMMGDDLYMKKDIERVMQHKLAVLGLEVEEPKRFGVIYFDEKNNLSDIVENPDIPAPALANIALYKLNKDFFNYPLVRIPNGEYGLPQTMIKMMDKHKIVVEKATGWFPIGNPEDLEKAQKIIEKFHPVK